MKKVNKIESITLIDIDKDGLIYDVKEDGSIEPKHPDDDDLKLKDIVLSFNEVVRGKDVK